MPARWPFWCSSGCCSSCPASSTFRRSTATRRASRRPPSRWSRPATCRHPLPGRGPLQEAGRHLLVAGGVVEAASALGAAARRSADLAVSGALDAGRDRRGAADLLDGARLRHAARRGAGGADPVQFDPARRRGAAGQDRRDAAAQRGRDHGRDGAGLSGLGARRGKQPSWTAPAIFWTAMAGGILLKGPLILLFVGLTIVTLAMLDRSLAWLWRLATAARACRGCWRWCCRGSSPSSCAAGDSFFANAVGDDMLSKITSGQESHGAPPGVYFLLFWVTFWPGAALAAMAAPAIWRARREAGAQYPAGLAGAVLDRVRTGDDQAAALRAAAVSGDRHPDGGRDRATRAVAHAWLMRGAAWWFVIPADRARRRGGRRDLADPAAGVPGLAVRRGIDDPRADGVVAVRRRPRRTIAAQRDGVLAVSERRGSTASWCRR